MDELLWKATEDAENLIRYFRLNKLCINASKTEFVIIRPDCKRNYKKVSIVIDGHLVEESTYFKILGLTLSNKLSFQKHIDEVIRKSRVTLGSLKRLSYKVDRDAVKTVAESKIHSKITYGGFLFITPQINNVLCMNTNHKELRKIVNEAARIISKKSKIDRISSDKLYELCNLKSINEIIIKQLLVLVWEAVNEPNHPVSCVLTKPNVRTRMASLEYFRSFGRNNIVQNSFINSFILVFNNYKNVLCQISYENIKQKAKTLAKQICDNNLHSISM